MQNFRPCHSSDGQTPFLTAEILFQCRLTQLLFTVDEAALNPISFAFFSFPSSHHCIIFIYHHPLKFTYNSPERAAHYHTFSPKLGANYISTAGYLCQPGNKIPMPIPSSCLRQVAR
jgi:hypothetical protein